MRLLLLTVLFISLSGIQVQAQIYKVVTPDGRTIYTDSPPEDLPAEEVDLPELIIEPATRISPPSESSSAARDRVSEQRLPTPFISRPTEQQVIPPGQRQVSVVAETSQDLPAGYSFILLINGEQVGGPATTPVWTLENPNPGQQLAQVVIIDEQGSRRMFSEIRTFFVIR